MRERECNLLLTRHYTHEFQVRHAQLGMRLLQVCELCLDLAALRRQHAVRYALRTTLRDTSAAATRRTRPGMLRVRTKQSNSMGSSSSAPANSSLRSDDTDDGG